MNRKERMGVDGISRRDFLNGLLLAAGGAAVSTVSPLRLFSSFVGTVAADNIDIDVDPRGLRGGNIPSSFNAAHWLRDGRLKFSNKSVTVAPQGGDQTGTEQLSQLQCQTRFQNSPLPANLIGAKPRGSL